MDRRGFLKAGAGFLQGALALSVLPGLAAAEEVVGRTVLWLPDRKMVPMPEPTVVSDLRLGDALEFAVCRSGDPRGIDLLRVLVSPGGRVRWVAPPGEEIVTTWERFVECMVSSHTVDNAGSRFDTSVSSSGALRFEKW